MTRVPRACVQTSKPKEKFPGTAPKLRKFPLEIKMVQNFLCNWQLSFYLMQLAEVAGYELSDSRLRHLGPARTGICPAPSFGEVKSDTRRRSRARDRLDITVPTGMFDTAAISL
jgi:hypothetical protein